MKIEHKLQPIEHWIVDGKAYRLATCDDAGKDVLFSRRAITESRVTFYLRALLAVASDRQLYRDSSGAKWGFAYIQDDSLLSPPTPQRTPVSVPEPKPIDWTSPVRTKLTKWPVTLITVKGRGDYPIIGYVGDNTGLSYWDINGESPGYAGKDYDGLENVPQRIQKTHWMNIDSDGDFWAYESKEAADADRGEGTVACIPFVVDCEEGEGL